MQQEDAMLPELALSFSVCTHAECVRERFALWPSLVVSFPCAIGVFGLFFFSTRRIAHRYALIHKMAAAIAATVDPKRLSNDVPTHWRRPKHR